MKQLKREHFSFFASDKKHGTEVAHNSQVVHFEREKWFNFMAFTIVSGKGVASIETLLKYDLIFNVQKFIEFQLHLFKLLRN